MESLETLNLSECRIGKTGIIEILRNLYKFPRLKELYLSHNSYRFDDTGMKELRKGVKRVPDLKVIEIGVPAYGARGDQIYNQLLEENISLEIRQNMDPYAIDEGWW